ncbi:aldo/keto reductase [Caballeronia sp. Lep1P3]|uniref:aldo/keto reductase n=1 Tax=Caballeronia sp. Lep1P3 TaxID=2878150 RepID=UPI001FD06274|nr:aldo/keto reductase [Caballeronia sp. Lep1P3]
MRTVLLTGTPVVVSRFVFGTAGLFNSGSEKTRRRLLFSAADAGFTHFDTAPYYGFGLAERDLSCVLKQRPDVTVTTKVGLYSPGGEEQSAAADFMRKASGRLLRAVSRPQVDFSLSRAQRTFEGSLRRLGRDVIDIYTLHDPDLKLIDTDEWLRWLESLIHAGKVRTFGLALTREKAEPFLAAGSQLTRFIQVHDSLDTREADILTRYRKPFQITYGYVSASRRAGSPLPVSEVLRQALERNADGAIIVSTTQPSRLSQYARLVDERTHAS